MNNDYRDRISHKPRKVHRSNFRKRNQPETFTLPNFLHGKHSTCQSALFTDKAPKPLRIKPRVFLQKSPHFQYKHCNPTTNKKFMAQSTTSKDDTFQSFPKVIHLPTAIIHYDGPHEANQTFLVTLVIVNRKLFEYFFGPAMTSSYSSIKKVIKSNDHLSTTSNKFCTTKNTQPIKGLVQTFSKRDNKQNVKSSHCSIFFARLHLKLTIVVEPTLPCSFEFSNLCHQSPPNLNSLFPNRLDFLMNSMRSSSQLPSRLQSSRHQNRQQSSAIAVNCSDFPSF